MSISDQFWVTNINRLSAYWSLPCKCKSWLRHYIKNSCHEINKVCCAYKCTRPARVGVPVVHRGKQHIPLDIENYEPGEIFIIPLCNVCSNIFCNRTFKINAKYHPKHAYYCDGNDHINQFAKRRYINQIIDSP